MWGVTFPILKLSFLATVVLAADGESSKTYISTSSLANKKYEGPTRVLYSEHEFECKVECQKFLQCFAYAFSKFARICHLYVPRDKMKPVSANGFVLSIERQVRRAGFFQFGDVYIKLYLDLKLSAYNAEKHCEKAGGMLVAIKSLEMNSMVSSILESTKAFKAIIGLTDEDEEGTWTYFDGTPLAYDEGWTPGGYWNRTDRNCAKILADASWVQADCHDRAYFFCEIPIY